MLFLTCYQSLCDYSASITKSKEDAEGVVQDVFAALWQNRESLEENVNIKAFLFVSAKNRSLDILQHKTTRIKFRDQIASLYQPERSEDPHTTSKIIKRVSEEVENLPEKCKTVYLLHRRDGLSYSEIAQVIGISKKGVEARMTKALKILRQRLQNEKERNLIPFLAILAI